MLEEIKDGKLYYNGVCLEDLAIKYKTPLKITFLDVIKNRVTSLKKVFDKAILDNNYQGKFIYLNANKANYAKEEILTAFAASDGLETSSYYDLLLTMRFFKYMKERNKLIVCNGFKLHDYLDSIIEINDNGYDITDIIDSYNEYEYLKSKNIKLKVGLRIHLEALYSENENEPKNDRFGLTNDDIEKILSDIKNTNLILTTIHFHQRGFDYEKEKFDTNFEKAFKYYVKAKQLYPSVTNFDIGGGTPLPITDDFDYEAWSDQVVKTLIDLSKKYKVSQPNLISENGKYSQKDSTVNIYSVVGRKDTDKIPWLFLDGSPLIAMPEMYALGEPIVVKPINGLDKNKIKVRLGGMTCDCDDIYFEKDLGYFLAPDISNLMIGCIGTGSYQNSMNGKGGVHHCLLPEETDVIVYTLNNKLVSEVRKPLQTIKDICKIIHF